MIEATKISTAAGTFDALACGRAGGREVLMLHGFPQAAIEWEFQLSALGNGGCHVVAPDQRGYSAGARPERAEDYRLEELVSDVAAFADELGWERFDLIGHDWGAYVGWAAAAEFPDRVRTLTAVSMPHPAALLSAMAEDEDQALRSQYLDMMRRPRVAERILLADNAAGLRKIFDWKIPEERVDDYIHRLTQPEAFTAALNWYRAMHLTGPVPPVPVPTLYVWGTEDATIGSTAATTCAAHVTGPYRFEMLEDISHWIPEQSPEVLTMLIMEHLLSHRA
ncbi:alpha/beta fold hydrolase [Nocardia bovistercoris]|uniref:alpha/beta fold hydrolase n=1 Tax=Nocardia bovistercoris TaxID=2785916 RepID=UPI0018AA6BC6